MVNFTTKSEDDILNLYPKNKKNEYKIIQKGSWDEPQEPYIEPDEESIHLNYQDVDLNAEDILRYLFEYVDTYFNQFGHHVRFGEKFDSWWNRHKYGTSYQPIVQCCYIRKGIELGFSVREHHSQKRITELAIGVHGVKYDRETKMKSYENIDVCWAIDESGYKKNNLILALEFEDSGNLNDLFQELYLKLIQINSKFTVLCSRLNYQPDADLISIIEEKLKKDNITKPLIFIFIAPDSTTNPTKICFSEFVNNNSGLKRLDDNNYFIKINAMKFRNQMIIEKLK